MTIHFSGDIAKLTRGIAELADELSLTLGKGGIEIAVKQQDGADLSVTLSGDTGCMIYDKPHHFFRAMGHAVEQLQAGKTDFAITEHCYFDMNGPMFDVSQGNSVFNIPTAKKLIRQMALMGLSTLMMYCEDSYEVKSQPYFGYMRARFSEDEMRELVEYAEALGIEMIPCIQVLAHLADTLRWKCFADITDYDDCLLVGEEKTYAFIEDLITAAIRPFKTKKINIGMDEAMRLGRGKYLDQNGYTLPSEIMKQHLSRVMEIVRRHGLEPIMYDDMFFRVFNNNKYWDINCPPVPDHIKEMVPPEMYCGFWDYYHVNQEEYEAVMARHQELTDKIIFFGGTWTWVGYSLKWDKTLRSTAAALGACKKLGVRDVVMTTWGDNGTEALMTTTMIGCQLFAEHAYAKELDYNKFKARFAFCTGGNAEDFEALDLLDKTPDLAEFPDWSNYNPSKWLMWQDILTGLGDKNIEGVAMSAHYKALAERLKEAISRNGYYDHVFELSYMVAHVLSLKAEMGLRLTAAYKQNDKETLIRIANIELPELKNRVEALRCTHRAHWLKIYKALGFDVMDLRYGGVLARIDTAIYTVSAYLSGELERIEELEEPRRYFDGKEGPIKYANSYARIATPSRIAADT